jgi:glutathione S-transferase
MSLTLHFHPLASYCHKALIALCENDTPFTPNLVDLGSESARGALKTVADRQVSGSGRRRAEPGRPGIDRHH